MRRNKISETIGNINQKYVDEANFYSNETKSVHRNGWMKWGGIAACFALLFIVGALIMPNLNDKSNSVTMGGIERDYKNVTISGTESNIEWPWEDKTIYEKYTTMAFDGKQYNARSSAISKTLLGKGIGSGIVEGVDSYTDKKYTQVFDVRQIKGISDEQLVAVDMDGEFYVFMREGSSKPSTLGNMLDLYSMEQNLELHRFTRYEGNNEKGYYILNDDNNIWKTLSESRDAKVLSDSDSWEVGKRNYISFTATSEALGVYKRVFDISEDGYLSTNIFDQNYIYHIGEEAAKKILNYSKKNSTETEFEPYEYSLAGTVTEIGDGYVLVDDSIMCTDENDGMIFKVLTDDVRMKRCIDHLGIEAGDIVVIKFKGTIDVDSNNTVAGAYTINVGQLIDGGIAIPE